MLHLQSQDISRQRKDLAIRPLPSCKPKATKRSRIRLGGVDESLQKNGTSASSKRGHVLVAPGQRPDHDCGGARHGDLSPWLRRLWRGHDQPVVPPPVRPERGGLSVRGGRYGYAVSRQRRHTKRRHGGARGGVNAFHGG